MVSERYRQESRLVVRARLIRYNLQYSFGSHSSFGCSPNTGKSLDTFKRIRRSRESLCELELALSLANRLHILLDARYQAAKEKVNAVGLGAGLSSLPDEILSEVLVLATRPPYIPPFGDLHVEAEMQALQDAQSLSHVCRRFRSLVLDTPRIWNIISEHMMDTSQVRACIERSKQMPMDILLEHFGLYQRGSKLFSTFFKLCLLSSTHWRSLTIGRFSYPFNDSHHPRRRWKDIRDNMLSIGRLSGRLALPHIKRLIVHFNHITSREHWETKFHPYWQWSMPNLVELRLSGCHPPPADVSFAGSLQFFSIFINADDGQAYEMIQLAMFLSSCKVLERVGLRFAYWNFVTPCPLHHGASTVQDVEFDLHSCTPTAVRAICNSVHFPEASKLSLLLSNMHFEEADQAPAAEQEALIRDFVLQHPLTTTFRLDYDPGESAFISIAPPLVLPALEKLILSFESWTELKFWGSSSNSADFRLPPIRILELHAFDMKTEWKHLRIWVEMFFAQLRKQGDLAAFELFAIFEREGRSNPSMLDGAIHDYLPLEKFDFCPER